MGIIKNPSGFKKDFLFVSMMLGLCLILFLIPTGFEDRLPDNALQAKGRIVRVDNTDVRRHGIIRTGTQDLTIEILNGRFKGRRVNAVNNLLGKLELDKIFAQGDLALITLNLDGDEISWVNATNHYRVNIELFLLLFFALLLVVYAGFTGAKALLSFLFAGLMIWKLLIPAFLKNYDPILTALAVVAVLTGVIIFLVVGLTRRGLVAFLGSLLGLGLTCALALIVSPLFSLHGAVRPFSETLLYSGFAFLDLKKIFLASIFLASSGAVMDLATDIAAAMDEVAAKHPAITRLEALGSGLRVGRTVVGTMTTTLLLAYSGSYLTMMMLFMGQGIPLVNIFSLNYVAAEILHTLVGSFGLVTVAPFTALAGSWLLIKKREEPQGAALPHPGLPNQKAMVYHRDETQWGMKGDELNSEIETGRPSGPGF